MVRYFECVALLKKGVSHKNPQQLRLLRIKAAMRAGTFSHARDKK